MTVLTKTQNGTSPAFILRPMQGLGHRSDRENTRLCLPCSENRPTKGGYFAQGFFFCGRHERRKAVR